MANAVYPTALEAFTAAEIDWLDHDIKVALLNDTYTYDPADEFLDDVTGTVATSANLASKTNTGGALDAADVTFDDLTGADVESLVVYRDTGTPATSRLIAYIDTRGDTNPLSFEPDGTDLTLRWNAAGIVRF